MVVRWISLLSVINDKKEKKRWSLYTAQNGTNKTKIVQRLSDVEQTPEQSTATTTETRTTITVTTM